MYLKYIKQFLRKKEEVTGLALTCSFFLITFSGMAQQTTAKDLLALSRDTLVEKAVNVLKEQLPELCNEQKGFNVKNFERISLRSCGDDHLSIHFGFIFKYIHDSTKSQVYDLNADLIQKSVSYEIFPSSYNGTTKKLSLYIPDKNSRNAVTSVMEAYRKMNRPQPDSQYYNTMTKGMSWEIKNKPDYYDIQSESYSASGWSKVHKTTLEISGERHKHKDTSSEERCIEEILYEQYNFPQPVFLIENKPVSKSEFENFLSTLKENPNTWYCAETTQGGITGYDANDVEGVTYQVRFISEGDGTSSILKKTL